MNRMSSIPASQNVVAARRYSVAPMMDWTDRHERYFLRLITHQAMLYTEMISAAALLHGDRNRLLVHSAAEYPLGLQLGGSDPREMALCARFGEAAGFNEINMNVGCPSPRVQSGRFGACLMAEPELVSDCFSAMASTVRIPVTIKCRIGIDDRDSYDDLESFVTTLVDGGCRTFIVHARKAWLTGLSPKKNREVPPLHYNMVYRLKQNYSDLEIIVNGGICSIEAAHSHLKHVDGVMVGREAYQNPFSLADVDGQLFGTTNPPLTRWQVLDQYKSYVAREIESGTQLKHMSRHILGLFSGQAGARAWRRYLSEHAVRYGAGLEVIEAAERIVHQKMQHVA